MCVPNLEMGTSYTEQQRLVGDSADPAAKSCSAGLQLLWQGQSRTLAFSSYHLTVFPGAFKSVSWQKYWGLEGGHEEFQYNINRYKIPQLFFQITTKKN